MVILSDSYMGVFLPENLSLRIHQFLNNTRDFPFIEKEELMGIFYLYGKNFRVSSELELLSAKNIAKKTMEQLSRDVRSIYDQKNISLNSDHIRENYTKRILQISIETKNKNLQGKELLDRIYNDPNIVSNCFIQHLAYYKKNYFFELYEPFTLEQLPFFLRNKLEGRMVMLGFNVANSSKLPFDTPLAPFFTWITNH